MLTLQSGYHIDREPNAMRILHVDDHWAYRAGLAPLLTKLANDVTVIEAASFEEALKIMRRCKGLDLVLLDLLMPDMGRFEGLQAVHNCLPDVPCVIVSMIEDRQDVIRAIDLGAMGYIPKTATREEILLALRRILGGEIWIPRTLLLTSDSELQSLRLGVVAPTKITNLLAGLTARQRAVLDKLAQGKTNIEIAHDLGLSKYTVRSHVSALLQALDVKNRVQAAQFLADSLSVRPEKN